jgi:hypothetical protein
MIDKELSAISCYGERRSDEKINWEDGGRVISHQLA